MIEKEYQKIEIDIKYHEPKKRLSKFKQYKYWVLGLSAFMIGSVTGYIIKPNQYSFVPVPIVVNKMHRTDYNKLYNKDIRDWSEQRINELFNINSDNAKRITTNADFIFDTNGYNSYIKNFQPYYKKIMDENYNLTVKTDVPYITNLGFKNGIQYYNVKILMTEFWKKDGQNSLKNNQKSFSEITYTVTNNPNERQRLKFTDFKIEKILK